MVSTQRAGADAAARAASPSKKGFMPWFTKQPMWLRITIVVVAIILLPTVFGLIAAVIKGLVGVMKTGAAKMKAGFGVKRKVPPVADEPAPGSDKSTLEGK